MIVWKNRRVQIRWNKSKGWFIRYINSRTEYNRRNVHEVISSIEFHILAEEIKTGLYK